MFKEIPANNSSISRRKLVLGVGINDAPYKINLTKDGKTYKCPFYISWHNMLKRCYCEDYKKQNPAYRECSVCEEWLIFSNFRKWMVKQDWKGKALDKDLLIPGNKVYSEKTCLFISQAINNLIFQGDGFWYDASRNKYQAKLKSKGKTKHLGRFKTKLEATTKYFEAKVKELKLAAEQELNSVIKNALYARIEYIYQANINKTPELL